MKPTVISQDTPWHEIHTLLLPAYGETWLMVAIVMLFVVTLGGVVGVCYSTPRRGDYFHILRFTRCLTGASTWGALCPFWC